MGDWFFTILCIGLLIAGYLIHDYMRSPGMDEISCGLHLVGALAVLEPLFDWNGWGIFLLTLPFAFFNAAAAYGRYYELFVARRRM